MNSLSWRKIMLYSDLCRPEVGKALSGCVPAHLLHKGWPFSLGAYRGLREKQHIPQLSNGRLEAFWACHSFEKHKAQDKWLCIKFNTSFWCQPGPVCSTGFVNPTAISMSSSERRGVHACFLCYMVTHTLARKERCVLDLLADLWLALQCCRFFREQRSSFLCCYFKAAFLLPLITEAVCKLRSFRNLNLSVRAQRDPFIQGKIHALFGEGGKNKFSASFLSLTNFNTFNFLATVQVAHDRNDNCPSIQWGNISSVLQVWFVCLFPTYL